MSFFFRQWIEQRAATSAGQHNISMTVLATLPIPLPPAAEQNQIVAEVERGLSVIDELEAAVEANLTRAERLRQSVLAQAFSGSLVS
ncbi:restriction endonuclease subunit S [Nitrospira sp. BLG_2]|uniref:restriction endonuclease subunit S n=1 Tax=Nitrospira sp. BLG_2 TaxID=3397507 RepID=UPI003B9D0E70